MEITIKGEDVAEFVAAETEEATGAACEVFSNDAGSVVVCERTTVIARVTPLFSVIDVAPLRGPFIGDVTEVPLEAETIGGLREMVGALNRAASHVIGAAMNR